MTVRIGLWGATQSGKTTFLAALGLATFRSREWYGRWEVRGADFESEEFLNASTAALLDGKFPPPSLEAGGYHLQVSGRPPRRRALPGMIRRRVRFDLEALDIPGRWLDTGYQVGNEDWRKVLDYFARCHGLVYLHDLTRQDNGQYFLGPLQRLYGEVRRRDERIRGLLPHHLAVCVAKFDQPQIFNQARDEGWPQQRTPFRVPQPSDAKAYFEATAEEDVARAIAIRFAPKRTKYFVTSAVGFRTGVGGRIDPADCSNVDVSGDEQRIIGDVQPVNVLEPLIWLAQRTRRHRQDGPPGSDGP